MCLSVCLSPLLRSQFSLIVMNLCIVVWNPKGKTQFAKGEDPIVTFHIFPIFQSKSSGVRQTETQTRVVNMSRSMLYSTPCLKKVCKFRPIAKIFGTKIEKSKSFSKVYSFSTYGYVTTRNSAIAGRPCDAKACQGLLKWTWKSQPRLK